MGRTYFISPPPSDTLGDAPANDRLFGANVVFTKDYLDPGGPFDELTRQLGFRDFRFPGGTVTEERFGPGGFVVEQFFDVFHPNGVSPDGGQRLVTTPAMFEYATEIGAGIHFVFPTNRYFTDEVGGDGNRVPSSFGIYRLLDRVDQMIRGDYGPAELVTFTIGNEFWYEDDRQTVEEYALMADRLSVGMQRIFNAYRQGLDNPDEWVEPKIAVQVGRGWRPDENEILIDGLSMAARDAIDVVEQHFYPRTLGSVSSFQGPFDRLDDFQEAEGFGDLEYFISEWNISSSKSDNDHGLKHASALPEIMRLFIERGVDEATIWGTQYLSLDSRLSRLIPDDSEPSGFRYHLTAGGEMFRMMSRELPDLWALDVDTPWSLREYIDVAPEDRPAESRDQMTMHAFQNDDRTVVFLASRTDRPMEVTFDPSQIVSGYHHVEIETLSVIDDPTTDIDEGDPTSKLARPYMQHYASSDLWDGDGYTFTFEPWQIVRFGFTTGEIGVTMRGHDQVVDPAADYDDELSGSTYDDTLIGNHGDDLLRGFSGNDLLNGGEGNDTLDGGEGEDTLLGGAGDDLLLGRRQNDILFSGTGTNILSGGVGSDHFIVDIDSDTTITDLDPRTGETVSFLRHYDTVQQVVDRAAVVGDDIVITHDGGGVTTLAGLGASIAQLPDILADARGGAPSDDIVDMLLVPEPDGSLAPNPDPDTVVDPNPVPGPVLREFEAILSSNDPDELQAAINAMTSEEFGLVFSSMNINVLTLAAPASTLITLVNNLSSSQIKNVAVDDTLGDTATVWLNRVMDDNGGAVPEVFFDLKSAWIGIVLDRIDEATEARLMEALTPAQSERLSDIMSYDHSSLPNDLMGINSGDPHLLTFDGVAYDFNAAGEYVLTRATDGSDFEIQARMSPGGVNVTYNEAVAMRLGSEAVMIDATAASPLSANGVTTIVPDGGVLYTGLDRIHREGDTYTLIHTRDGELDTGYSAVVVRMGDKRVDITVALDSYWGGNVEGLLGNADGNAANDIALADGTPLERPLKFDDVYGQYRDDWRVDDAADSLFSYGAGEGPDSYYLPNYPTGMIGLDSFDPADVSAAEAMVTAGGLVPGTLAFQQAVLDYILTGDETFIDSAINTQAVIDSRPTDAPAIEMTDNDGGGLEGLLTLSGKLTDLEGEAITGATVTFQPAGRSVSLTRLTRGDDEFSFDMVAGEAGHLNATRAYDAGTDPEITSSDALDVLRIALGLTPSFGPAQAQNFVAADINDDGRVTTSDALEAMRHAMRHESENSLHWKFFAADTDWDALDLNKDNAWVESGVDVNALAANFDVPMTGILLGNMETVVG